ncbi:unnamed protein product (macronuclear) [Paramecium tetraurelia]|uniref:Uncharacterized protein n=1 Tax=Paramecium tetraurelia TaxID=5888 RepID=A0EAX8_PARTE|nr:uncharacterized protein GSPATT00025179001 [Paramecium tetraurelia]CAK92445.1 unnamed protein product [Paramecium tetraurelia]|eukprot:XP_001459842.1 hypothetical protein (macronuclear) [Paramecium tetraurelia strain d4-2]
MRSIHQYNQGLYKIWKIMKKVYTVPTPREQKPKGQQKSQNDVIKQTQFAYIPDQPTQKEQSSKMARPYLMFKPKLVEEIDENNMKKMKLSFHNSITDLQTFEELAKESQQRESTPNLNLTPQEKTKTFVRKSMRHLTQL